MNKIKEQLLQSNIWKYFIFSITQRRSFIPILSIFFLTLPNTTAQQIGFYTAIGTLSSFIFEIPSGYFADKFGHKRTLVLSKILMLLSIFSFLIADSLVYFISGAIFMNLSFAFSSGTTTAFMHETLVGLKKEKQFTKIMSKISANVSIIAMVLLASLPFLTSINIRLPLVIHFFFDIFGLIIALTLISPPREKEIMKQPFKSFFQVLSDTKGYRFYSFAIFTGAIGGYIVASTPFREVYLQGLGFPIIFIGFVMALSRLFWFIFGHYAHLIEKHIRVKKLFLLEIFFFSGCFILVSYLSNPYVIGGIFSLFVGYFWGRSHLVNHHFIRYYIKDKRYKATLLSIKMQVTLIFQMVVVFLVGFVMTLSYKLGYFVLGISLFVILLVAYIFIKTPGREKCEKYC